MGNGDWAGSIIKIEFEIIIIERIHANHTVFGSRSVRFAGRVKGQGVDWAEMALYSGEFFFENHMNETRSFPREIQFENILTRNMKDKLIKPRVTLAIDPTCGTVALPPDLRARYMSDKIPQNLIFIQNLLPMLSSYR
uniref:Uncharacterized protein n=1 Tax=Romanomermis culicivorax TaxID=13658 RepID=A0A915HIT0_ROMCU